LAETTKKWRPKIKFRHDQKPWQQVLEANTGIKP